MAQDVHVAQGDGLALRVDHPHGGRPFARSARSPELCRPEARQLDAAGDSGPQPHSFRRIGNPDFDLKRPGSGIGLGRHFPHAAGGSHLWVIGEVSSTSGSRAVRMSSSGTSGTASPPCCASSRPSARRGDLARFGTTAVIAPGHRRRPCSSTDSARCALGPERSRPGPGPQPGPAGIHRISRGA